MLNNIDAMRWAVDILAAADAITVSGLLAIHQRRPDEAPTHLADAAGFFAEAGMPLDAAACRRRRGELIGGADGAREIAEADQALGAIGIASPERWSAMVVPAVRPLPGRRLLVE